MAEEATFGTPPDEQEDSIDVLATNIAEAAWDKKAQGLKIFDVRGLVSYADFLIVCSANSERHVVAISNAVEREMRDLGYRTLGVEGRNQGRWVLMDYGDVVMHLFTETERDNYALDSVWADAPILDIEAPPGLERPAYPSMARFASR
jgi:ribosome-associated protein